MRPITVWLNKNLSSAFNIVESLRRAEHETFRIVCSHTNPDFPAFRISDAFEVEPRGPSEAAYLDYCDGHHPPPWRRGVHPGQDARSIVGERRRFEELGVKLVHAGGRRHAEAAGEQGPTSTGPFRKGSRRCRIIASSTTSPEFDDAVHGCKAATTRCCFKPAVSMFGLGFRVVDRARHGASTGF